MAILRRVSKCKDGDEDSEEKMATTEKDSIESGLRIECGGQQPDVEEQRNEQYHQEMDGWLYRD